MKISIAMATYNGAKYIHEQFESFARQTRLPDEVVVSDDSSTDNTLKILYEIKKSMPYPVKIIPNKKNLGFIQNFGRAIESCSGELIFLSDHDDYWFPERLEYIHNFFEHNPSALVVANDAEIANEFLQPTGYTKLGRMKTLGLSKNRFITGCCTAFKACLVPIICPIPFKKYPHDAWIHSIGEIFSGRFVIEKPLLYFRRHQSNTSSPPTSSPEKINILKYLSSKNRGNPYHWLKEQVDSYDILQGRLKGNIDFHFSEQQQEVLHKKIFKEKNIVAGRLLILTLPLPNRFIKASIFYITGGYRKFSGVKSLIKDCFFTRVQR